MEKFSQEEINERVAVLKRFKALLSEQRKKFQDYLLVLEKQQDSIVREDTESLLAHTELEQQVIASIANMQKVIVPMTEMYAAVSDTASSYDKAQVSSIQNDLEKLQSQILAQNEKNRKLLRLHISQIQEQMKQLNNPYKGKSSVYAEKATVGNLIEVKA